GALTYELEQEIRAEIKREIEMGLEQAYAEPIPVADSSREYADLFAEHIQVVIEPKSDKTQELRFVDAISQGLQQSMEKYPELVLMGQDIGDYGGVFKITEGFVDKFGRDRVRNTPLCESAIIGVGLGLSIK